MKTRQPAALFAGVVLLLCHARALDLPPHFSNNMILQRGAPNRIWGQRTPGVNKEVWVEFLPTPDAKPVFRSDTEIKKPMWEVELPVSDGKGKNRGAARISIWEGTRKDAAASRITLDNVLIGDVWIVAIPRNEGFALQPQPLADSRAILLNSAADLDTTAPPNKLPWADPQNITNFPVLAKHLAIALRSDDPSTPLGLIVTTTEQWPGSLQLTLWESLAKSGANFLKNAARSASPELKERTRVDEEISMALKHQGKITNAAKILPYSQMDAFLRVKKYPKALEPLEWQYKGAIAPSSRK
jgi:hypothetical protein